MFKDFLLLNLFPVNCSTHIFFRSLTINLSKFQCQDNCKECYFGFCQKCEQDYLLIKQTNECNIKVQCNPEKGLYYNDILNQCYEIQSNQIIIFITLQIYSLLQFNGIISENEQCEDYNLDPYDGCYDCKYSCYSHCPLCIQGVCTDDGSTCQKGYYFDKETGFCFNVCGDGIIAMPDEECDEINNTDCVNCKKINEKNCKILMKQISVLLVWIIFKLQMKPKLIIRIKKIQFCIIAEMAQLIKMNFVMMVISSMEMDVIRIANLLQTVFLTKRMHLNFLSISLDQIYIINTKLLNPNIIL
ncbi:unnamed protein product [Paramecium sonneborni]|uniref:Uncharacterized protein n=1 Tax=Paramecium sonneborni TaxID=65129 RepID=A0A8S1QZA1_9CILI|nr:unnamed protein product [Paramecium sonneborni]